MSNPRNDLIRAKQRADRAEEACPHWDYMLGSVDPVANECCAELHAAHVAVCKARRALDAEQS